MKTIRCSWLLSALIAIASLEPNRAPGSTITWTNTTGGSWNTPANWSPHQVPAAGDTALVSAAGTYTVTQNVNVTVSSLIVGGGTGAQTLLNNSYTLTLSGPGTLGTNGTLALVGGAVTGAGLLEVQGVLSWSSGSLSNLSVVHNGLVLLSGSGDKMLKGALTNWGTVRVTGASDWSFYDGNARLVNEASGLVDVQNDRSFATYYGGGSVWNGGRFRKSAGTGVTTVNVAFSSSGWVEVQSGTLRLNGGGALGGTYDVTAGAVLEFSSGSFSVSGAPVFGGAGVSRLTGGTLTLSSDRIANLGLVGGTVVLGPGFQGGSITNLTLSGATLSGVYGVSGQLNWEAGYVGGSLTVASNGVVWLSGSGDKMLQGVLTNWGTVRVTGASDWRFWDGNARLVNEASGLVDVQNDRSFATYYGGGSVWNGGRFRKSAGTGVTTVNIAFSSSGWVEVQSGTLRLNGGGALGGTYDVTAGAVLEFSSGSFSASGAPVFGGAGVSRLTGGTLTLSSDRIANLGLVGGAVVLGPGFQGGSITNLTLSGATLSGVYGVSGQLNWEAGYVGGSLTVASNGVVLLSGSGDKMLQGALTNWGTVRVTGASDWRFWDGNARLVNEASGLVDVQNDRSFATYYGGGSVWNGGRFRKSAGTGVTTVNIAFSSSGWVEVQSGTLRLNGGGALGGTYDVTAGAVLEFSSGSFSASGAPVFGGAGVSRLTGGTLTLSSDRIANLGLVGGTVVLGPGFQGGSITNLTLSGATLSGVYGVSGQLNWEAGYVGGPLTVASNGVVWLSGSGDKMLQGALTNWGTVRVTGASDWRFWDGNARLVNEASGLVDVQNDRSFATYYGGGSVWNGGRFRKSAGTGVTTVNIAFSSSGWVEVQSGTLRLNGGGALGGTYDVTAGAVLEFSSGSFSASGAPVFGGAGVSRLTGGTLTLSSDRIANLGLVGGTVVLGPGFQGGSITNLTLSGATLSGVYGVSGQLNWEAGYVGGPLTVASNGVVWLSGSGDKMLQGALTNWGTVRVTGASDWRFWDGNARLVNEASGLVDVQNDRSFATYYGGGSVWNGGTFRKSAGTGVTTVNIAFSSSGWVEVQSGTLRLNGGGALGGTYDVTAGAVLEFSSGSFSASGAPVFGGAGVSRLTGGTLTLSSDRIANLGLVGGTVVLGPGFQGGSITNLTLSGATLSGVYGVSGQLNWEAGYVGGPLTVASNGVVWLSGSGDKMLQGALTNWGTVRVTGASDWRFWDGNARLVNEASGLVDVQNDRSFATYYGGGSVWNGGRFRKSAGTGVTTVNIAFSSSGWVEVQSGTLRLNGGGALGGTYDVTAGAVLEFSSGSFSASGAPVFGGAGVSRLTGGTLTLSSDRIANLGLVGGTVVLGPGFQGGSITNLTLSGATLSGVYGVSGQLNWEAGYVGGSLTVASNGVVWLSGSGDKMLQGVLTNWGTVRVTGASDWRFYDGNARLVNEASGLVDVQNDRSFATYYGGGSVWNGGTFRKSAGTGVTTVNIAFSSSGWVEVQSGTLRLNGTYTQTGGTLSFRLNSLSDFGRITTSQTLQLTGALAVTFGGGYLPGPAQHYDIISAPVQGVFQSFTASPVLPYLFIIPSYKPNGVQLVTTNATPSLSKPVLDAQRHFTMEIRGIASQLYVVEASTNFVVWTPLATNAMPASMIWLFVDQDSLTFPYRFYRVRFEPQAVTPTAPYLTITRSNNTVIVSWPLPATGWLLHATTNLVGGSSVWTEIPPPYQTNDPNLQFTEPAPTGHKFYRLHKP